MSELVNASPIEIYSNGTADGMTGDVIHASSRNLLDGTSDEISSQINGVVNNVDDVPALTDSCDSDESDSDSEEDAEVDRLPDGMCRNSIESNTSQESAVATATAAYELKNALTEGGQAAITGQYKVAAVHYQKVVNLLARHTELEFTEHQRIMLQFALGLSEVSAESQALLLDGLKHFQLLIDNYQKAFHVLGFYGLAAGYCRQNRYADALQPVEKALGLVADADHLDLTNSNCFWPGTETVMDVLSSVEHLKDQLEDFLYQCRAPPVPDAVCRFSACTGHFKRQIYLTDLDFKGFVSVYCQAKCVIEYHVDCWRKLKTSELEKRTDKEMLNATCFTPDCKATVCRIRFYGPDGGLIKEFPTDLTDADVKPKKPKAKQPKGSVVQHGSKGGRHRKEKGPKGVTQPLTDLVSSSTVSSSAAIDDGGAKSSVSATAADKSKDNTDVVNIESTTSVSKANNLPAASSFPLLPPDGGHFVALQKKPLIDDMDENYVSGRQKKSKLKRDKPKPTTMHLDEFVEQLPPDMAYDSFLETGMFTASGGGFDAFGQFADYSSFEPPSCNQLPSYSNTRHYGDEDLCAIPQLGSYATKTLSSVVSREQPPTATTTIRPVVANTVQQKPTTVPSKSALMSQNCVQVHDDVEDDNDNSKGSADADIKDSLFSLFASLLERHGPCYQDDPIIQRELEQFPTEAQVVLCQAGGISKFLQQSLQFAIVDGYICLTRDVGKARKLVADRRRVLLLNSLYPSGSSGGSAGGGSIASTGGVPQQLKINPPPQFKSGASSGGPVKVVRGGPAVIDAAATAVAMKTANASTPALTEKTVTIPYAASLPLTKDYQFAHNKSQSAANDLFMLSVMTTETSGAPGLSNSKTDSFLMSKVDANSMSHGTAAYMSPWPSTAVDVTKAYTGVKSDMSLFYTSTADRALTPPDTSALQTTHQSNSKSASGQSSNSIWQNVAGLDSAAASVSYMDKSLRNFKDSSLEYLVEQRDSIIDNGKHKKKSKTDLTAVVQKLDTNSLLEKKSANVDLIDDVSDSDDECKVVKWTVNSISALDSFEDYCQPRASQDTKFAPKAATAVKDIEYPSRMIDCLDDIEPFVVHSDSGPIVCPTDAICSLPVTLAKSSVTASEFVPMTGMLKSSDGTSKDQLVKLCSTPPPRNRTSESPSADIFKLDKSVMTIENWDLELREELSALKKQHSDELLELETLYKTTVNQMKKMESQHESEKLQHAMMWKNEKLNLEKELKRLNDELTIIKSNLERQYQTVIAKEKLLHETTLALTQEQEKNCALTAEFDKFKENYRSVTAERDKLRQLVGLMQASRAEEKIATAAMFASHQHVSVPTHNTATAATAIMHPAGQHMMNPLSTGVVNTIDRGPAMPQTMSRAVQQRPLPTVAVASAPETNSQPMSKISSAVSSTSSKTKQSFEKILTMLTTMFPDVQQTELTRCVQEVRASRGNSLSGLKMQEIVKLVSEVILKRKLFTQRQMKTMAPPPGLPTFMSLNYNPVVGAASANHGTSSSRGGGGSGPGSSAGGDEEIFEEEENPCIICHEELVSAPTSELDCGHTYHTACIRQWFREQNTCPTCRNHTLLHDDFPTLRAAASSVHH